MKICISLYYMVLQNKPRYTMTLHDKLCQIMIFSYIVYGECLVCHGLPVSKHHGVLPWFPFFKTP